jgi:hypothetical protein
MMIEIIVGAIIALISVLIGYALGLTRDRNE